MWVVKQSRCRSRHVTGVSLHDQTRGVCLCFVNRDYERAAGRHSVVGQAAVQLFASPILSTPTLLTLSPSPSVPLHGLILHKKERLETETLFKHTHTHRKPVPQFWRLSIWERVNEHTYQLLMYTDKHVHMSFTSTLIEAIALTESILWNSGIFLMTFRQE